MSVPKVVIPTCSQCGAIAVLDPCRDCMTPAELAAYPLAPIERENVPAVDIEPAQAPKSTKANE